MAAFLPRNPMPREFRVYPVAGSRMATADELVAVFMDRWHLIGPRVEGDPDTWFRTVAARLWRDLSSEEISDSVNWLASLLDSLPDQGDRDTLRMLELALSRAFAFSTRDRAPRAALALRPSAVLAAA